MAETTVKETLAMELKYLGLSYPEIAERAEVPLDTIRHWFESKGKLSERYQNYSQHLNKAREKKMRQEFAVSDSEVLISTTNIMRSVSRRLQPRKVLLVNKDGQAVADANGMPQYVDLEPDLKLSVKDYKTAWEIQRIMHGKPTSYIKQEATQDDEVQEIIQTLGLTDADFTDETREATYKRINQYLAAL